MFCIISVNCSLGQSIKPTSFRQEAPSLGFIENKGQIIDQNNKQNPDVKYLLNLPGLNVQLKANSFSYDCYVIKQKEHASTSLFDDLQEDDIIERYAVSQRIDIEFIGANTSPQIICENPAGDYLNYYTTSLAESGATLVKHFEKVSYINLYPGIDLVFIAQAGTKTPVEYKFILHPGADLSVIRWKYIGSENNILKDGKVNIQTTHGILHESIPYSYEFETGRFINIEYKELKNNIFGFDGSYNTQNTLVIDPVPDVVWASYYGSSGRDKVNGVATDSAGNVYITGETTSTTNIATSGSHLSSYAGGAVHYNWGGDAYVAKLDANGSRVWGTYYGGSDNDQGNAIVTNKDGDSYVAGCAESTSGIATTGAFQASRASSSYHNPFLAKFNSAGSRQWGTYFASGGNDHTGLNTLALDKSGHVYIAGSANCVGSCQSITTTGAYQTQNSASGTGNAYNDAFVAKFSPSGSLVWGTYFGGNRGSNQASHDQADAGFVDDSNYVYIAGSCESSVGIASTGAHQTSFGGSVGSKDGFIAKINSTGTQVMWATYYGGSSNDYCRGVIADDSGYVYASGISASSSAISTSGSYQASHAGGSYDAFLVKFDQSGTRQWGTYFGGGGTEVFSKLSQNSNGDLIVTGYLDSISSISGLATTGSYQTTYGGGSQDGLIVKFTTSGSPIWCSYFGGSLQDMIYSNTVDTIGNIYISGLTFSTNAIATSGTHSTSQSGQEDGFVAKIQDQLPIMLESTSCIQPDTSATPAGTLNKMIIGIKVNTTGGLAAAKITQFKFDTAGIFNYANINGTAKVYYTANIDTFNTSNLFDSTASTPSSTFTISGSQILDTGSVYFWLTLDIKFNATVGEYLDAQCIEIKWDSAGNTVTNTPIISSPAGDIRIIAPLKKLNSISFSQPTVDYVYRYSTDNPILRVDLNVIGTGGTLPLNQLEVAANNTDNSDVSDVKLYFTTSAVFSKANMIGSATSLTGGIASFTSLNYSMPTGTSYIWITYDIPGSATIFDTVDAKISANGINIGGILYPTTEQNPTGKRIIFTNFQYDAGVSSIISPAAPYCDLTQTVKVKLNNYGVTTLTSDTVQWTINGVDQSSYIWTGSLATGNSSEIVLGTHTFSMGTTYTIKVFPSYINGVYPDSYHQNDTATLSFTIYPTPVANFTINDNNQCFKGNSFEFSNTTSIVSGSYTSNWSFGDANYSTSISPTHSYQSINTFPVTLIVSSAYGCTDSISKNVILKPNQTTAFSMSDTAMCYQGNSFSFTNNSTFGYGTLTNLWDFGDNSSSTTSSPSHTYNSEGNYQVKLVTTSNTGCIDSLIKTVDVYVHPVTSFQITTDSAQCLGNNLFVFNNSSSISSGSFTSLWSFGDNSSSTNTSPTKSYTNLGNYTIQLVTTSDFGCTDSQNKSIIVRTNPITDFSINDSSQCMNSHSFVFTNNSSISSGTFNNLWNFGDQTTSTNTSFTKTYASTGIYDVKLVTESNYGCKDSISKKVYVRPNVGTYFIINDSDQCLNANSFMYSNYSSIISGTYTNSWDFGDNTFSTSKSPTKKYLGVGIYTVKLITTSNYGCKDSLSRLAYVRPHPVVSFSINDSAQCVNANLFDFTNNTTISSGSFSNSWDFGDFDKSTLHSPAHAYTTEGTLKVKLTASSNYGCKASKERRIIIHPRPFSFFTQGMNPQCLRSNLFYMDNHSSVSSGSITNTYWQFGDGDSSDLYNPKHKYLASGNYTIRLKVVTSFGCIDTSSRKADVIPQPEAGMIISDTALCFRNNVFNFTDDSKATSGSITNYFWNFGDGKFNLLQNTSHSYKSTKSFLITHIVTSSNGCKDTVTQIIEVHPMPVAMFSIMDSIQCQQGNSFVFENTSTFAGDMDYQWTFGDGETSIDSSPVHSYDAFGNFKVKLISITADNCPDTIENSIMVKQSPKINLGNDTTLYHNQSIKLNAGNGFDSYLWSNSKTTSSIVIDTTEIGLDNPTIFWVKALIDDCDGYDSVTITFIHNVSINDPQNNFDLLIYPNPTKDFIYIESNKILKDVTISLTDLNGKLLRKEIFNNENQKLIDMRVLANGIYFINLNSNEKTEVVKIIKY